MGGKARVRFSVTLEQGVADRLDEIARRRGSSRADVVRELVLAGLDRARLLERLADAVEVA